MLDEILEDLTSQFDDTVAALRRNLSKIRTGRANPTMLDDIRVEYYGSATPLTQASTVKVVDPRMLMIQPWDKSILSAIEKAIMTSGLGLNPSNDGSVIRVPIPALTGERRKQLTRTVREIGENSKIALRNHRRDANDMLKTLKTDAEISEDDMHRGLGKVQESTNQYVASIDKIVAAKEAEILEV